MLPVSGSEEQTVTVLLVSLCRLTESEAVDHHQGHNLGVQGTVRVKKHKLCCANHRIDSIWISSSSALSEIQTVWERGKHCFSSNQRISNRLQYIQRSENNNAVSERTLGGELPKTWTNWVSKFHQKTANCCERRSSSIRGGEWEVRAEKEIKKECEGTEWRCVCVCVFSESKEKQQCGDTVNTTRETKCQQITAKGTQGRRKKRKLVQGRFSAAYLLV